MWFADVVCNLDWYTQQEGSLGIAQVSQNVPAIGTVEQVKILLYCSDLAVNHLRIIVDVTSIEEADNCVNQNLNYWIRLLEVATGFTASHTCSAAILPGTISYMVVLGEGDENSPAISIKPSFSEPIPMNYRGLAACIANWHPSATTHLFYLGRFLDVSLPLDVRWLNGYRLAEWHFEKGATSLPKNSSWRALLMEFESELNPYLQKGQTLHGFMQQTRALAAHAIVESRPEDERIRKPGDPIIWTFHILEKIVARISNDPSISRGFINIEINTIN